MLAQALLRSANTGDRHDNLLLGCACYTMGILLLPLRGGKRDLVLSVHQETACLLRTSAVTVTTRSSCIGRHGNTGPVRRDQQYWRAQAQSLARRCASRSWSASQWCARRRRSLTLRTSSTMLRRSRRPLLPLQHRERLEGPHWR